MIRLVLPAFGLAAAVFSSPVALAGVDSTNYGPMERHADSGNSNVVVDGGLGVGQFQDIQVPVNEVTGMRGDGTPVGAENTSHIGIPMHLGLALESHLGGGWTWTFARLDALQMTSSSGAAATSSASYSRLALSTALERRFELGGLTYSVAGDASFRRSGFANVSTSHYVEAALLGGTLGVHGEDTSFEMFGRMAPWASFGYSESAILGGHALPTSTVTVSEIGGKLSYLLRRGVWFETGLSRESARVTIKDIDDGYSSFGLSVLDDSSNSRAYDLETLLATIGIRKEF